jgi:SAM-dependent methyltransferase
VHHWHDLEAGLAEVRRVLAPGGRFVALERRTEVGADGLASHGWTDAQAAAFAEACRAAGFVDVRLELPVDVARHRRRHQRGGLIGVRATTPG